MFWLGSGIGASVPLAYLGPAILFLLYWRAAVLEERLILQTNLAASYARYRRTAGLLWPTSWGGYRELNDG